MRYFLLLALFMISCGDNITYNHDSSVPNNNDDGNHQNPSSTSSSSKPSRAERERNSAGKYLRDYPVIPKVINTDIIDVGKVKGLSAIPRNNIITRTDKRYQQINTFYDDKIKNFNHINLEKGARVIKVSALELHLKKGEAIYSAINGKLRESQEEAIKSQDMINDIAQLEIHADTLIVSDPLYLPSTELTIYANKIIFEASGQFILTPAPYDKASEDNPKRPHREDGLPGLDAPVVKVYANEVVDPYLTKRFILRGGKGQKGGPGINGKHGANLPVPTSFKEGDIICTIEETTVESGDVIWVRPGISASPSYDLMLTREGLCQTPHNGEDATPGGRPGLPGKSGIFFTNHNKLVSLVDVGVGEIGDVVETALGGKAGKPTKVTFHEIKRENLGKNSMNKAGTKDTVYTSEPGKDAPGPRLVFEEKQFEGQVLVERIFTFRDVINTANIQRIKYIEDTYQRNSYKQAYDLALLFAAEIKGAMEESSDEKIGYANDKQNYLKLQEIIAKIEANKNFYGEDAFSIPFLSLNNSVRVYKKQIDDHLKTLYLAHFIESKSKDLSTIVDLINAKQKLLADEIHKDIEKNEQFINVFDEIDYEASVVERDTQGFIAYLEKLENEITNDAQAEFDIRNRERKKKHRFKTILKTLAAVAKVVPVGQPALATAVTSAEGLIENFSSNSWKERYDSARDLNKNIKKINFKEIKEQWSMQKNIIEGGASTFFQMPTKMKGEYLEYVGDTVGPTIGALADGLKNFKKYRAPQGELEHIINEMKDGNPEFQEATRLLTELNHKKMTLDAKINETLIGIAGTQSNILENTSILMGLSQDGEGLLSELSPESMEAIHLMAHNAHYALYKYLNYFSRVYYFRTLSESPIIDFDLKYVKEEIERLLKQGDGRNYLNSENLAHLKTILLEPVRGVFDRIFDGTLLKEQRGQTKVRLTGDILKELSNGTKLYLNLSEAKIFVGDKQKNPRIREIKILDVKANSLEHVYDLRGDFYISHAGHSIFEKDSKQYFFTHLNANGINPFAWGRTIDFTDSTNQYASKRHNSFDSLLGDLIGDSSFGREEFIFPSAASDFSLSLNLSNPELKDLLEITEIELEIDYIFTR